MERPYYIILVINNYFNRISVTKKLESITLKTAYNTDFKKDKLNNKLISKMDFDFAIHYFYVNLLEKIES